MARGRFISNKITTDRKVHELSSDTCRLAYTWAITLADRDGRIIGEPEMLLAQLFPRRVDITVKNIQAFIDEWIKANFIFIYLNYDGDKVIQFKNFEKNQLGLRKNKEPESIFDEPDKLRIIAGTFTEEVPSNRIEENINRIEENAIIDFDSIQKTIEKLTGYPPNGGKAVEAINEILSMGATIEDIKAGYQWLIDNGKTVQYYQSLVNPTRTAMSIRMQESNKTKSTYTGAKVYDE